MDETAIKNPQVKVVVLLPAGTSSLKRTALRALEHLEATAFQRGLTYAWSRPIDSIQSLDGDAVFHGFWLNREATPPAREGDSHLFAAGAVEAIDDESPHDVVARLEADLHAIYFTQARELREPGVCQAEIWVEAWSIACTAVTSAEKDARTAAHLALQRRDWGRA